MKSSCTVESTIQRVFSFCIAALLMARDVPLSIIKQGVVAGNHLVLSHSNLRTTEAILGHQNKK